jgi:hypothetical protein
MRAMLAILVLGFASVAAANDPPVTLMIAPRSMHLPASGKMVFDLYWHNWTDKPAAIPALDTYWVFCWAIIPGREGGEGRSTGSIIDHPAPDRAILPHAVVHDTITAEIELKPKEIGKVSLTVSGEHRKDFKSNEVVFTRR